MSGDAFEHYEVLPPGTLAELEQLRRERGQAVIAYAQAVEANMRLRAALCRIADTNGPGAVIATTTLQGTPE